MSRGRLFQIVAIAVVVASWLSLIIGLALDQNPEIIHGRPVNFSETQQGWARTLAAVWLVLGIGAFFPGVASLHYAEKPFDRGLAFVLLAASAAVPIMFYFLVASGYFADYGS
jgi:hypothetical protein